MKVMVIGGDGFCGWPTSLKLAKAGHEITIIDNLSRRKIDVDLGIQSLTQIASIQERVATANELIGAVEFVNIDVSTQTDKLRSLIDQLRPDTIIQFAEQRSAPYSMMGDSERRFTVDNNVSGTHNILSAIVDIDPTIHLVHLGTMGVYGYNKDFGAIPEGYLDVKVLATDKDVDILYPANPGSIYHMTKCLDQLLFQFYNKNWGVKITDLHQGIVWGVETEETKANEKLVNRFDYDGVYGTVLNRFIVQAVNGVPLTVYGTGGQTRAFIHIADTARCIQLAAENPPENSDRVRIFNQLAETKNVLDLAKLLEKNYGAEVKLYDNPRKELAKNDLEVDNCGLVSLGFEPHTLEQTLVKDVSYIAHKNREKFDGSVVLNSPRW